MSQCRQAWRTRRRVVGAGVGTRLLSSAAVAVTVGCAAGSPGPVAVVHDGGSGDAFVGTLLTNPSVPRPELLLPDTTGRAYDLGGRADGVTALFFGYTQCPDVCPTTMADLAAASRRLPAADRERLEVVFVTEDPADTATVLRRYLDRFDPTFVGLTGGNVDTERALDELNLPRTERDVEPTAGPSADREVQHTSAVYLFGPGNRQAVLHTGGSTAGDFAADIAALLAT